MADENLKPKRSPVKPDVVNTAIQGAHRPTGRPALTYIEDTLGHALDPYVLSLYHNGYFDAEPTRGPLTAERIREAEVNALKSRRDMDDHIRHLKTLAAARAARAATAQTVRNPADYTCVDCKKEFELLKHATTKLCPDCALAKLERDIADEQAKARAAREHEPDLTIEELRVICREWRAEFETAQQRVTRTARLNALIEKDRNLYIRILHNPAREASVLRDRCWSRKSARQRLIDRYRTRLDDAEQGYEEAKRVLRWRRNIHAEHRYCRNDGLMLPWNSLGYCDDKCQDAVQQRGDVHFDMGPECGVCGARLTGPDATPETIAALPRVHDEPMHTWECLMSQPIDEDDYTAFGPDAACWKPVLHVPGIKPAWTYKERFVHALPTMPTTTDRALPPRPNRAALPSRVFESLEQEDDRRMLEWAARFNGDYFTLTQARVGTGKGWIATARIRPTIDRLVGAGKLVEHPGLKNRWKTAEQNENR